MFSSHISIKNQVQKKLRFFTVEATASSCWLESDFTDSFQTSNFHFYILTFHYVTALTDGSNLWKIYTINAIGISSNGAAGIFLSQLHRWLVLIPYRLVSTVWSDSKITRNCKTLTKSTASICRQWKLNTVRNGYFSSESNKMTSNWYTKIIIL